MCDWHRLDLVVAQHSQKQFYFNLDQTFCLFAAGLLNLRRSEDEFGVNVKKASDLQNCKSHFLTFCINPNLNMVLRRHRLNFESTVVAPVRASLTYTPRRKSL